MQVAHAVGVAEASHIYILIVKLSFGAILDINHLGLALADAQLIFLRK